MMTLTRLDSSQINASSKILAYNTNRIRAIRCNRMRWLTSRCLAVSSNRITIPNRWLSSSHTIPCSNRRALRCINLRGKCLRITWTSSDALMKYRRLLRRCRMLPINKWCMSNSSHNNLLAKFKTSLEIYKRGAVTIKLNSQRGWKSRWMRWDWALQLRVFLSINLSLRQDGNLSSIWTRKERKRLPTL